MIRLLFIPNLGKWNIFDIICLVTLEIAIWLVPTYVALPMALLAYPLVKFSSHMEKKLGVRK